MSWIFVDDFPGEAQAFADQLAKGRHPVAVEVVTPAEARDRLLTKAVTPAGVLMDVDLSNVPGERGSGPGIAQDLRVKQRAGEIAEYPIVRFAARAPVERNVKGDPGSDDLFDLKILKEELAQDVAAAQLRLIGLEAVYAGLAARNPAAPNVLNELLGLDDATLGRWSHEAFHDRLLSALQIATHVAAGAFMRGFLTPTGLLVSDSVLSYRLGVDARASGRRWEDLLQQLPFRYMGIASDYYRRWWARGLEDWWLDTVKSDRPLVSLPIRDRVQMLSNSFGGLVALTMPAGSAGDKPWRLCALSLEADPPVFIPVDPTESVRFTPRADAPAWTDPTHVSLRLALQRRDDFRLNRNDLIRLQRKHQGK
jgi:hypothetical protein